MKFFHLLLICTTIFIFGCASNSSDLTPQYLEELDKYRANLKESSRLEYLELIGRYRIDTFGQTYIGSATGSDIEVSYNGFPDSLGVVTFARDSLHFKSAGSNWAILDGQDTVRSISFPVNGMIRTSDLSSGKFSWHFLHRGNQFFIRIKDHNNPAIDEFKGYEWFPPVDEYIFDGTFTSYPEPRVLEVPSVFDFTETTTFIGNITFSYEGEDYSLEVGEKGFLMFADETSGAETYGAGRYVYVNLPPSNGPVTLDFNYAYNPPCIFSTYTVCMFAPSQNRLPFAIRAGETNKER